MTYGAEFDVSLRIVNIRIIGDERELVAETKLAYGVLICTGIGSNLSANQQADSLKQ